jgi:enoyl-[acyl-carrier protein] reductase III
MSVNGGARCALVTGSSRGIGRGIAWKLAEQGIQVAVTYYQNADAAKHTLAGVRERESDGFVVQADVSRSEDVRRLIQQVDDHFGRLDIFVSNARPELPTFYQPPLELNLDSWRMAIDSQATAFLVGVQQAMQLLRSGGRVVAITYAPSTRTGSWQPWVGMGSAKAALESLVRYFAVALARREITVNAVSPGLTEDSVLNGLPEEVQSAANAWHQGGWTPMGRLGSPADIGNVVALLCSEQAGWLTGQTIHADGGASLMDTIFPLAIQGAPTNG